MAQNNEKIPKFIARLYKVTDDNKYKGITWTPEGDKIHVYDREEFVTETLPLLSKTKEYSTFVRILNNYGFVKSNTLGYEDVYKHKAFLRGREDLLQEFRTNKAFYNTQMKVGTGTLKEMVEYLYRQNASLNSELVHLKEKLMAQERTINGVLEILTRVFRIGIHEMGSKNQLINTNNVNPGSFILDGTNFTPNILTNKGLVAGKDNKIPELLFQNDSEESTPEGTDTKYNSYFDADIL